MGHVINVVLITSTLNLILNPTGVMITNCTCVSVGGRVISADCLRLGWTEIPKDLPSTLLSLNMAGNLLVSLPDSSLAQFPALERLDLSDNSLRKLGNRSFSGLFRRHWLSLRRNSFHVVSGTFPVKIFQNLTRLTYLDLQSQALGFSPELVYPDEALSSLRSLRTLRMDGLANDVDLGPGFAKLHQLEVLDLNGNTGHCHFTALSEKFFASINTSRPLTLNLTHCEVRKIHRNTFSFLPTLHILPRLQFFDNRVEVLDLSRNRLPCFIGPWLGLHKLRYFDLSKNFAVYLSPDLFTDMSILTHLFLQGNFLGESFASDVDGLILSALKNLEVLNLSDNYIKHLSPSAFQAQENLKNLSLARNAITRFRARVACQKTTLPI